MSPSSFFSKDSAHLLRGHVATAFKSVQSSFIVIVLEGHSTHLVAQAALSFRDSAVLTCVKTDFLPVIWTQLTFA